MTERELRNFIGAFVENFLNTLFKEDELTGEGVSFAICFNVAADRKQVHWVTNVSREDGIKLFEESASDMKNMSESPNLPDLPDSLKN